MDRRLSIKAGKDPVACGCGQDEKVVVLIGLAQAGKRSLITCILRYGSYDVEARQFNSGAFRNTHITEEMVDLRINMETKKHALQDENGETKQTNLMAKEPEDLYELKPTTEPSDRHLHIRLIDTPSIYDDWVHAPIEESSDEDDIYDRGSKSVDKNATRKLRILKEVSNIRSLHGIFFVLNRQLALGATTLRELRAHIDFFREKNIGMTYSFLHTHTSVEELFAGGSRQRATAVDRALGIQRRSKHYLINNHPDPEDEISLHFSWSALTEVFEDLTTAQPRAVPNIWRQN